MTMNETPTHGTTRRTEDGTLTFCDECGCWHVHADDPLCRAPLGKLVGQVLNQIDSFSAFLDDPITREYGMGGEMGPAVMRGILKRVEALLTAHGFETYQAFIEAVEARTTAKWVYQSSLGALDDDGWGAPGFYRWYDPS